MTSLRRRLMLGLFAGLALGGVAGGLSLYWLLMEELDELFDDRLQTIGDNLTPEALSRGPFEEPRSSAMEETENDDDIVVQLWSHDGQLRFASNPDRRAPAPGKDGLFTLPDSDTDWRNYVRATADGGYLQVAQAITAREEMAAGSALRLLLPMMALVPLLAAFTAWTVSRQLQPLRSLESQIRSRKTLTPTSIVVEDAPQELEPVVSALNELLARQADASRKQQAFLADAAHELRTPLSVVSLQAQRVQQAVTEPERREAIDALKVGVDRATRLVAQLLSLARSDAEGVETRGTAPVQLDALLKNVLAEMYPLAVHKHLDLGLADCESCIVNGDIESLRSLIANLVDNALRHTPAGGKVDVSLQLGARLAFLVVADDGPGIPLEQRRQAFERFVRGGTADVGGTGLGLAIARQVAERHHGSIALEDGEGGRGLTVRVALPLAA